MFTNLDPSEPMAVFFTKKTSLGAEVGTQKFVRIWKFRYEHVSLTLKSLQIKSKQNLVHSHVIGFSGSVGLGLVKIIWENLYLIWKPKIYGLGP